jgi:hypothetical protein
VTDNIPAELTVTPCVTQSCWPLKSDQVFVPEKPAMTPATVVFNGSVNAEVDPEYKEASAKKAAVKFRGPSVTFVVVIEADTPSLTFWSKYKVATESLVPGDKVRSPVSPAKLTHAGIV